MISSSFDFPAVAIMNAPPNKIHFVAIFGIENAAAHFQDSRAKIHSKAAIHSKMNCFSGIARGFRPHKASAAQAVAAFFTRLFYHRQKALSSTFYAFCGKNMNQLLQSHFVRQLPQGGSLWRSDDGRSLHLDQLPQLQRADALIGHLLRGKALIDGKGVEVQLRAVGPQEVCLGLVAVGLVVQQFQMIRIY